MATIFASDSVSKYLQVILYSIVMGCMQWIFVKNTAINTILGFQVGKNKTFAVNRKNLIFALELYSKGKHFTCFMRTATV